MNESGFDISNEASACGVDLELSSSADLPVFLNDEQVAVARPYTGTKGAYILVALDGEKEWCWPTGSRWDLEIDERADGSKFVKSIRFYSE